MELVHGNQTAPVVVDLCGNQLGYSRLAISAPRPSERPKLGHDPRETHATGQRQKHLTQTPRDPELKHKLNFDFLTGDDRLLDDGLPGLGDEVRALLLFV